MQITFLTLRYVNELKYSFFRGINPYFISTSSTLLSFSYDSRYYSSFSWKKVANSHFRARNLFKFANSTTCFTFIKMCVCVRVYSSSRCVVFLSFFRLFFIFLFLFLSHAWEWVFYKYMHARSFNEETYRRRRKCEWPAYELI